MACVLIVDDKPEIRSLLKAAVEHAGYTAMLAGSAAEAWQLLAQEPDVVMADIGLPGEDGVSLATRIRGDGRHGKLPMVFVTARSNAEQLVREQVRDPVTVVEKPFRFDDIGRALDEIMAS
jgi:CheY-like chemotaxis protein